jgi:hypothetical protein
MAVIHVSATASWTARRPSSRTAHCLWLKPAPESNGPREVGFSSIRAGLESHCLVCKIHGRMDGNRDHREHKQPKSDEVLPDSIEVSVSATAGFLTFKCSIEPVLLSFPDAHETSIAAGFVSTPLLAARHPVDSGVGPRWLASAGARGSDVHTSHPIHR